MTLHATRPLPRPGCLSPLRRCSLRLRKAREKSPSAAVDSGSNPRERIAELAKRYHEAKSYQDAGELRFLVDGAPKTNSARCRFRSRSSGPTISACMPA